MSAPPPGPSDKLQLRAQRKGDRGDVTTQTFTLPPGLEVRLGREPRDNPGSPTFRADFGADLVVRGDLHISNWHATLTWDGGRVRVRKVPSARNPVFLLDPLNPDAGRPAEDFSIGLFERFRIGNTTFLAVADAPQERTISGEELRGMAFTDPAPRVDALAALPDLIRLAPDDDRLQTELLRVLLRGVPRADVAAVVTADGAAVATLWRDDRPRDGFRPSRQLAERAVRGFENVHHVWTGLGYVPPPAGGRRDAHDHTAPTAGTDIDWALCVRLLGSSDEGLYVAGRQAGGAGAAPAGDLKFVKLAGDIYAALRDLLGAQRREGFLARMLAPVVRQAVMANRRFEEVIAPRELPVTVLFCDLRGFTAAVAAREEDLMGTWEMLSEALDVMTEAIIDQDGVVGDFQGDAAMGFWGWPDPQDDQIDRAARAALVIRRKFVQFSERAGHPLTGMSFGVGIAHGPGIAGKLGASEQMKVGVFGPVVNRASRLESATKTLRCPILLDDPVVTHLARGGARSWCRVRQVARVIPKGLEKKPPVLIGELLPPERERGPNLSEPNRRIYEAALDRFFARDWDEFRAMVSQFPKDGPVDFVSKFIRDCEADALRAGVPEAEAGRAPADWNGGIPVEK